jgi:hypothetical protein
LDLEHREFPYLNIANVEDTDSLIKVNDFEVTEISNKIGTLDFTDKKSVNLYLNFWYLSGESEKSRPLILEFTFDYRDKDQSNEKDILLEEFSRSLVRKAEIFYLSLQNQTIADHNITKTKTEYVYQYKPK